MRVSRTHASPPHRSGFLEIQLATSVIGRSPDVLTPTLPSPTGDHNTVWQALPALPDSPRSPLPILRFLRGEPLVFLPGRVTLCGFRFFRTRRTSNAPFGTKSDRPARPDGARRRGAGPRVRVLPVA